MNKDKLKTIVRKVSADTGIVYNSVPYYFMEDILLRISKSDYKIILFLKVDFAV